MQHYLHDEPVLAGPPGVRYRAEEVRAEKPGTSAGCEPGAAGAGGRSDRHFDRVTAGQRSAAAQAKQAETEREAKETAQRRLTQIEKANEILGSIFKDLNREAAERRASRSRPSWANVSTRPPPQLEGEAIGDPLAVARMQMTLGESQLGLGYPEKAIHLLSKARTTFTAQLGPDHPDTLASMTNLAGGYQDAGKLDLALPLFEETLKRRKAKLGPEPPRHALYHE